MNKQEEIKFFNERAKGWRNNISKESIKIANDFIEKLQIGNNNSVLDVAVISHINLQIYPKGDEVR